MLAPRKVAAQSRAVRETVVALLRQALGERQPADRVLAAHLRRHPEFGSRDRRLITDIAYAALRWWGWLRPLAPPAAAAASDWSRLLLEALLLERLPYPELRELWMAEAGVPAAEMPPLVEDADLAAKAALGQAPSGPASPGPRRIEALVPAWTAAEADCPRPLGELIAWLQRRPPLWLRIQHPDDESVLRELEAAGLHPQRHAMLRGAVKLGHPRVNLHTLPAYRDGRVEVQDLASQAVGPVCAAAPGQRWWDACAGGGGKSLLLAQLVGARGTVVATDIRQGKLDDLRRRARRGGFDNIRTPPGDGARQTVGGAPFDGVLVDAPCTGSGTWRRNPAARWTAARAEIGEMSAAQGELLGKAAGSVKPGGALVYATCSMFTRENETVVRAFLDSHADFRPEPVPHPLTGAPTGGMVRIWPWEGDCDAMFASRLRRLG